METVLANLGTTRRETIHGRQFIVAQAQIFPKGGGVLNGSKGALYYPKDEIGRNPDAWNGVPLVGYHPTENGAHVSGRSPRVIAERGLGTLWNVTEGDAGEAWFDVEAVRNFDRKLSPAARILPRLERGQPIELSTGLFTDNIAEPGTFNGRPYDAVARNYRPDHLAILPDQRGACSHADGCGVNVNEQSGEVRPAKRFLVSSYAIKGPVKNTLCPVANAGTYGNPQSLVSGKFKRFGSGTGKGPVHEAAQAGSLLFSDEDRTRGKLSAAGDHAWAKDPIKFERAMDEAAKGFAPDGSETYWTATASIYRRLGGAVGNAFCPGEGARDNSCSSSGGGGKRYEGGGWDQSALDARSASKSAHEWDEDSEASKKALEASEATNVDGLGHELASLHYAASKAHSAAVKEMTAAKDTLTDIGAKQRVGIMISDHQKAAKEHEKAGDKFNKSRALRFNPETRKRVNNAFCPGAGKEDNSCSPSGGRSRGDVKAEALLGKREPGERTSTKEAVKALKEQPPKVPPKVGDISVTAKEVLARPSRADKSVGRAHADKAAWEAKVHAQDKNKGLTERAMEWVNRKLGLERKKTNNDYCPTGRKTWQRA